MARTKQTLRMENQRKALSRPPPDVSAVKPNQENTTNPQAAASHAMGRRSTNTGGRQQPPREESNKAESNDSSLSPALSQLDQEEEEDDKAEKEAEEEAEKENTYDASQKRKRSNAAATPSDLDASKQAEEATLPLPDNKRSKTTEQPEDSAKKAPPKPNAPKKATRAQQIPQPNMATGPPPGIGLAHGPPLPPNANLPSPANQAQVVTTLLRDGFGFTTEDKRLLWAFKEVNKDFWQRVARGIVQLGGAEHTPEQCKERYEVLSRL